MSRKIAMDLGNAYLRLAYLDEKGEPTLISAPMNEVRTFSIPVAQLLKKNNPPYALGAQPLFCDQKGLAIVLEQSLELIRSTLNEVEFDVLFANPIEFSIDERQSLSSALLAAGFKKAFFVDSDLLAAELYKRENKSSGKVGFFDLGERHTSFSVLNLSAEDPRTACKVFEREFHGWRINDVIFDYLMEVDEDREGVMRSEISESREKEASLRDLIEKVKCSLSHRHSVDLTKMASEISLPVKTLSSFELNDLLQSHISSLKEVLARALESSQVQIADLEAVVMLGGGTRVPAIRASLEEFFEQKLFSGFNPEQCVVMGGALRGAMTE